ncbi:MAG: hypothetical protein KAT85_07860, partial [candidate division Zixibacteria bacterium]|nr:hypothetical protein [candidate division Zixibacteria bacterium]
MRVRSTKNTLLALLFVLVLFGATTGDAVAGKLNVPLQLKVVESPDQPITALVFLTADAEETASLSSSVISIKNFSDRYKIAYRKLRSVSDKALNLFNSEIHGSALDLEIGRRFWIANAVEVTATPADLERLAEFASVEIIVEDTLLELVEPVEVSASPTAPTGAEPNLVAINADDLWAMGITGEGRLVMSFDTGVDGSHPGLASRWRGSTSGNPSEGWYDPFEQDFPTDAKGHGTHVMGLMAGLFNG